MRVFTLTAILATTSLARACTLHVYKNVKYAGDELTFTSGKHTLDFTAASFQFSRGLGEACCATFCSGSKQTGYRCSSSSDSDIASQYRFNEVVFSSDASPAACY
jgi:hypothetical protein